VNILSDFWDSASPRSTPSLSSAIFTASTNHISPYSVANTNVVETSGGKHVYLKCRWLPLAEWSNQISV
jgi:hypothetical protein